METTRKVKELPAAAACLHATGIDKMQRDKPFIGIIYSPNKICPGHLELEKLADYAAIGVIETGGTPVKMTVGLGVCDGIAMGHEGMKYSLPSRELNADAVEDMVRAHGVFDGLILIGACDKNLPGYLMAAARLDLPTVFITPGPMMPGFADGRVLDVVDAFAADAQHALRKMDDRTYEEVISCACPGPGSCAGLFTANSMACVTEALGLSLPGMATSHAVDNKKLMLCTESGRVVMKLVEQNITARMIMDVDAFYNALRVDMAIGASTNTVLHIPAIAKEAGIEIDLNLFDKISRTTPNLVKISPSSQHRMIDFDRAGGVPAVMWELCMSGILISDAVTINGTVKDRFIAATDRNVICSIDKPHSLTGGIRVLKGNLAPGGAVIKMAGVSEEVESTFIGHAKVFDSEESATAFIKSGQLEKKTVLVIRYEGPAGGPGMREMLYPTSAIKGLGMDKDIALITDGRFSGGTAGICIGHVEPEAYNGGLIALVQDGDQIIIDLEKRIIDLAVDKEVLEARKAIWRRVENKIPTRGILKNFRDRFTK